MSDFLISFLLACGGGGWIYGKVYRRTGGITQNALAVAGISGVFIFIVVLITLKMVLTGTGR